MSDALDFSGIRQFIRGALYEGKFKIHSNGVSFKNDSTGKVEQIAPGDIEVVKWLRVAYHYELQFITKGRSILKYAGFREPDYEPVKSYLAETFGISLKKQDLAVKGWNHGKVEFEHDMLSFLVDEKPSFEVPLRNVTKCDTPGKNEVTIEFHQNDDADVELCEMRFWVPNSTDAEVDLVTDFHDKVMASADILSATGTAIMSFEEVMCQLPKGRHEIKFYPTCIQMRGKTNVWIVQYTSMLRLFLLPHNDGNQIFFVVSLDPPLKAGASRYHFVICQFHKDEEIEQELKITEEEIKEKYDGKIEKNMNGLTYEMFSRGMKAFSNRKITVPGSFKGESDKPAIFCGYKNNTGYLYPLERGFLYVPRPPIHLRFDEIAHVNFARGTGTLRSFDFEVTSKQEQSYTFSQIERGEYNKLFDFVKQKNIPIKNVGEEAQSDSDSDLRDSDASDTETRDRGSGKSRKREHDPYLEQMKKEGKERTQRGGDSEEEDDSDFAPAEEEDVAEEYDSHAEYVTSSEGEEGGEGVGGDKKKKERRVAATISEPGFGKSKSSKSGDSSSSRQKKSKPGKNANMPKRPMTAFMLFMNAERDNITRKNPDAKITEVAKIGGQMWGEMNDQQKKQYTDQAAKLKEEYNQLVKGLGSGSGKKSSGGATVSTSGVKVEGIKSKEFISDSDSSGEEEEEEESSKKKKKVEKEIKKEETKEEVESDDQEEESDADAAGGDSDEETTSSAPKATRSTRGRGGGEPLATGLPEEGAEEEEEAVDSGSGGGEEDESD